MDSRPRDVWVKGLGKKRGAPYLYLDGAQAIRAGFAAGERYDVTVTEDRVILTVREDGSRTVSSRKKGDEQLPVVDINSSEILGIFDGMTAVRVVVLPDAVHILPIASEVRRRERLTRLMDKLDRGEPLLTGSVSHGGGILTHAIHQGLADAGIESDLAFAVEIRDDLLQHASQVNDTWGEDTAALGMPMQEVAQDRWLLDRLPKLELLELGLPCNAASRAGKAKHGAGMMEDDPNVGHLVFSALTILNDTQPTVALFENVTTYATTASAQILRHTLRDMGYDTHEAILSGRDFGCLEDRVRWCMVAVTRGMDFTFDQIAPKVTVVRQVADIIDPSIGPDDPRWTMRAGTIAALRDKEVRDAENGSNFKMQTVRPGDHRVPTLRKGYRKGGSTDPLLEHPDDPSKLRQFTPEEHARCKGVAPHLIEGLSETMAHELLGQGIVYAPFQAVGQRIGERLLALLPPRAADDEDDDSRDESTTRMRA